MKQREIKFRIWDKKYKTMDDVLELDLDLKVGMSGYRIDYDKDPGEDCSPSPSPALNYFKFDEVILMQYTGLKDKNGKEIYEGDIVNIYHVIDKKRCNEGKYKVKYEKTISGFPIILQPFTDYDEEIGGYHTPSHFEVIGNIYENPELMEVK
jgi:uncharacterized phage protein (TIGR01671 family)